MESTDKALLERKVRKAFQVLVLQRGRNPGVKGWELKRHLGRDYRNIIEVLSEDMSELGLEVFEVKGPDGSEDTSRFLLRFREPPSITEAETSGIRIDDLAVLAATIAFVNSKQGRASRREVEHFLREKFPKWRVEYSLDRYVKRGYLEEDERSLLHIGWRTRAEVDEKTLMTMILSRGSKEVAPS
jgi:acetylornithine deacetylase/succinyl-diaminopimelate desuccinylase-like protein